VTSELTWELAFGGCGDETKNLELDTTEIELDKGVDFRQRTQRGHPDNEA